MSQPRPPCRWEGHNSIALAELNLLAIVVMPLLGS
jgi:hypothetical protein